DAHASDHVVLGLQNFHAIAVDTQADAAVGYVLKALGDQPVEGLGAILGQMPLQLPVDVAQVDTAVDHEGAILLGVDVVVGRQQACDGLPELGGHLAGAQTRVLRAGPHTSPIAVAPVEAAEPVVGATNGFAAWPLGADFAVDGHGPSPGLARPTRRFLGGLVL